MRQASHAGSWYTDSPKQLSSQLQAFLDSASVDGLSTPKALIGPHAGYTYCGKTAGYAYKPTLNVKNQITRVFVLGPSHHVYLEGCALSVATSLETPIGNLQVDTATIQELKSQYGSAFTELSLSDEEAEHSLEMHFPFVAKCFGTQVKVVPIMVGKVTPETGKMYGTILSKYLKDPATFFVVSSDFCHWGKRFSYTYYEESQGQIYESIQHLDEMGMKAIESLKPETFLQYMKNYKNTICGRNPITVLMYTVQAASADNKYDMKFVHYSQSSKCVKTSDSSVSYAAGILFQK
jgi:AmmeMemoRadiSam system protein B